ncbi:hypothetical protein ACFWGI_32340 [Streptomyces niveus]|uniref:hypothetical protein n=1 Tax=Streptomyces niveus TaxID=193462 RepID=UPI0036550C4B
MKPEFVSRETPIYSRLIAERGDIPAQVSNEADRLHGLLERVLPGPYAAGLASPLRSDAPTMQPAARHGAS